MQKTLRPGKDEDKHEPPDKDGNERSYYYDDAHGYETYIQGDEDDPLDASPIDRLKEEADTPPKAPDQDHDPS